MLKISNEKLYFDGYLVAKLNHDIPPSIRDRLGEIIEEMNMELEECEDCGRIYRAEGLTP